MKRALVLFVMLAAACAQNLRIAPVKVEPIQMTIDVNVHDATGPAKAKP